MMLTEIKSTQFFANRLIQIYEKTERWEHLTCAMSINAYSRQKLENLELYHKEK